MSLILEALRGLEERLVRIEAKLGLSKNEPKQATPMPKLPEPVRPAAKAQAIIAAVDNSADSSEPLIANDADTGSLFGMIGVCFVLLAAIFFLKLTIDSGWLTPIRQIFLASIFGISCLLLPHLLATVEKEYGGLLSGVGATILHLTWVAAFQIHQLISVEQALTLASLVGVLSLLLNLRLSNASFVLVAISGTYISAPLVGFLGGEFSVISAFLLIWNISFSLLAIVLARRDVLTVAGYFAVLVAAFIPITSVMDDFQLSQWLTLQTSQLGIFAGAHLLFSLLHKKPMNTEEGWYAGILLLIYYVSVQTRIEPIYPVLGAWLGTVLGGVIILLYLIARSSLRTKLASANSILSCALLILFQSLYFKITPEEFKPAFSLMLTFVYLMLQRAGILTGLTHLGYVVLAVVFYGALLPFIGDFSREWKLVYHFSYGLIALIVAGFFAQFSKNFSMGTAVLGFAHLQMLTGLYQFSRQVEAISGSLFVSLTWGIYALLVMAWAYRKRDREIGQSAVMILVAVALKTGFYDLLATSNIVRVTTLLFAGLFLYFCGWIFRKMQKWV